MTTDPYATPAMNLPPTYSAEGAISQGVLAQLAGTKPWVRFFSVMMFIGAGLMLVVAAFMLLIGSVGTFAGQKNAMPAGAMMGIAIVYALLAFVYIYPALKLWKYASGIGDLLISGRMMDLESALSQQRSFWKFLGIMMIAIFVLYAVIFIGLLAFGGFAAMKAQGH